MISSYSKTKVVDKDWKVKLEKNFVSRGETFLTPMRLEIKDFLNRYFRYFTSRTFFDAVKMLCTLSFTEFKCVIKTYFNYDRSVRKNLYSYIENF